MVAVAKTVGLTDLGSRFIKVDHAGEHGAVCIYSGQIFMARLTAPHLVAELTEFRAQSDGIARFFARSSHAVDGLVAEVIGFAARCGAVRRAMKI